MNPCDTLGCDRWGLWRVTDGDRVLTVCSACRDEMMSLWGWELL